MIDLHTHVLPGIDDGPATVEGSIELAWAAVADGTTTLTATPHVTWDMPHNHAASIAAGVKALEEQFARAGIEVALRTGGELAVTRAMELDDEELRALHLGGGEWVLAECPLRPNATGFDAAVQSLAARGHRILLAHPERSPLLQRDPEMLRRLVAEGMLTSVTAGALLGRFGSTVRRFSLWMVEEDLVHSLASDTHDAVRRPPGMREAIAATDAELPGFAARGEWLTVDVPRAILDGGDIPDAPAAVPSRRRRGFLRRGARQR